jgi:hypothetical protein
MKMKISRRADTIPEKHANGTTFIPPDGTESSDLVR